MIRHSTSRPALAARLFPRRRRGGIETTTLVVPFDHEPVRMEVVDDLNGAVRSLAVCMANGVRAGLRQCELEVLEHLVAEVLQPRQAGEGEPTERDVLGARRNREPHLPPCAVRARVRGRAQRAADRLTIVSTTFLSLKLVETYRTLLSGLGGLCPAPRGTNRPRRMRAVAERDGDSLATIVTNNRERRDGVGLQVK